MSGAIVVLGLIGATTAGLFLGYRSTIHGEIQITEAQEFTIPLGSSAEQVTDSLEAAGILDGALWARVFLWRHGLGDRLKAGVFHVEPGQTGAQLLESLTYPPLETNRRMTFPEGWRVDQMAERITASGLASRASVDTALETAEAERGRTLEGFLFPSTYFVTDSTPPGELIARMREEHERTMDELMRGHEREISARMERRRLDLDEIVTIASIARAEAVFDDELPIIARVIFNRLDRGMRLQMDPTCAYPPEYRDVPLNVACHDQSNPYSTYVIAGLPPTPIGNPGRAALRAALFPADDDAARGYLYFVARGDGSGRHVFSATYEAHRENVQRELNPN